MSYEHPDICIDILCSSQNHVLRFYSFNILVGQKYELKKKVLQLYSISYSKVKTAEILPCNPPLPFLPPNATSSPRSGQYGNATQKGDTSNTVAAGECTVPA